MGQASPRLLSSDHLESLETYVPGHLVADVAARFGIPPDRVVKLASAENPLGTSPRVVEAVKGALSDLHLYPDWRAQSLRQALAQHHGMGPEEVIVGAGETELIPLIMRTFSEQGDEILFPVPTFPIYQQSAVVERRRPKSIPMDGQLQIDPDRLLHAVNEKTRILILTSPNNPLSTVIAPNVLDSILERVPPEVLVLLDEAYVDYSEHGSRFGLLSRHVNLIVLRTFSKVYGLAGLRVGYGLAHERIVKALLKSKPTWNMGCLAVAGALAALEDRNHYDRTRSLIQTERDHLLRDLSEFSKLSVVMTPEANFVCLKILDPGITSTELCQRLLERGVIIKDCSVSYQGLGDRFVRVDVSLRAKMEVLLQQLKEVCR